MVRLALRKIEIVFEFVLKDFLEDVQEVALEVLLEVVLEALKVSVEVVVGWGGWLWCKVIITSNPTSIVVKLGRVDVVVVVGVVTKRIFVQLGPSLPLKDRNIPQKFGKCCPLKYKQKRYRQV